MKSISKTNWKLLESHQMLISTSNNGTPIVFANRLRSFLANGGVASHFKSLASAAEKVIVHGTLSTSYSGSF